MSPEFYINGRLLSCFFPLPISLQLQIFKLRASNITLEISVGTDLRAMLDS
jgi:hypothetical protein